MASVVRAIFVVAVGVWMIGTAVPDLARVWYPFPYNGLTVDFDGVVTDVEPGSPAAALSIAPGDRVAGPLPSGLFRDPPSPLTLQIAHAGALRTVTLVPQRHMLRPLESLVLLAVFCAYLVFLVVGSLILLLRPSPMTWAFYLYCVLRRYGDLGFYLPGSSTLYWLNFLPLVAFGSAGCVFVTIFALRFPKDRLDGWRRTVNRCAQVLLIVLPAGWLYVLARLGLQGLPSQGIVNALTLTTAAVYLAAATVFVVTLLRSHGEDRQRLRWVTVFPVVLVLRVIAILAGIGLFPYTLPDWFAEALAFIAISVPLTVAYAVVRRRVFDIEFAISRALVYAAITSMVAGTFLLLDWFMTKQFAQTRFTLTAEIVLALAIGSWLNMLHRSVDRFIDSTLFRQRHRAEERLAKAAAAVLHAESDEGVDRFLVHEPLRALELTSAALFRRDDATGHFMREVATGWDRIATQELTADDPLVLHLLAEGEPLRLADVAWESDQSAAGVGDSVLAMPVLLRERLVAIVLYGPHRNGADIDPDEVHAVALLVERAGAAYDHIEARTLRAQVEALMRERDVQRREIETLRASIA